MEEVQVIPSSSDNISNHIPNDITKFSLELNTALGLSFEYSRKYANDPSVEKKSMMTWTDANGNILRTETIVKSYMGPPGSLEQDVLTVLMSLCVEQLNQNIERSKESNRVRIYFTYAEICRRLGLSVNTTSNIKKALNKLQAQEVYFKDFICDLEDFSKEEIQTKIIARSGRVTKGKHGDTFGEHEGKMWVELDVRIANSLLEGIYSTIDRSAYLALPKGAPRRLYQVICSKRKLEGPRFILDCLELAQLLGLRDRSKFQYYIKKYLKDLCKVLPNFDFVIKKVEGRNTVLISFEEMLLEDHTTNSFYNELCSDYTEEALAKLEINSISIEALLNELGDTTTKFDKSEILLSEFCIDVAFHQVIRDGYALTKSIQSLVRSMFKQGGPTIPDSYKMFIRKRLKKKDDERLKEVIKHEIALEDKKKEEERTKIRNHAAVILQSYKENKPKEYQNVENEARKHLDVSEDNMSFSFLLNETMVDVMYKRIIEGRLGDKFN